MPQTQTDEHYDALDTILPVLNDSAIIDDSQLPDDKSLEDVKYSDDLTISTHLSDRLPIADSSLRKSLHTPAPIYKPVLMSPPYLRQAELYMDSG